MTPSPTPHCRVPSASRCLSSSSRPSARSACSSQAAVCLRPGAARWSRSRPSSKLAGCPSGPSQGLGSKGPDHPGQAFALATDSHLQPGAAASLPSARMQNTFPRPDRQFTNYGLVGPSSGSLRCCNTSTETCRGSRQSSPRLSPRTRLSGDLALSFSLLQGTLSMQGHVENREQGWRWQSGSVQGHHHILLF